MPPGISGRSRSRGCARCWITWAGWGCSRRNRRSRRRMGHARWCPRSRSTCAPDGDPGVITPADVMAAVLEEASGLSAGAGQHLAAALRAFLRYCHVQGLVAADVSAAAMAVTGRRTSLLPRGLDPGQVAALLGACDRGEPAGRRDYAVILLLARLGLRAGEAARLRLDDIGWRSAEIEVRGKGGQLDRLPLPADAGAAIAAWLRDGRPAVAFREVFTLVMAPA